MRVPQPLESGADPLSTAVGPNSKAGQVVSLEHLNMDLVLQPTVTPGGFGEGPWAV